MIKMRYQMPSEEAYETSTRRQIMTTTVVEEDCSSEIVQSTIEMLHSQNYDVEVNIKVKLPK